MRRWLVVAACALAEELDQEIRATEAKLAALRFKKLAQSHDAPSAAAAPPRPLRPPPPAASNGNATTHHGRAHVRPSEVSIALLATSWARVAARTSSRSSLRASCVVALRGASSGRSPSDAATSISKTVVVPPREEARCPGLDRTRPTP